MRQLVLIAVTALVLSACNSDKNDAQGNQTGSSGTQGSTPTPGQTSSGANTAPTISGKPLASVVAGNSYNFRPSAADANGDTLTFSIQNKPAWAEFDAATGALTGVPDASSIGTYSNIVIGVSDGKVQAAMPAFAISVDQIGAHSVTLSWLPPSLNIDGSPLTNLAGYRIYYGTSPNDLSKVVQISSPGISSYVLGGLSAATWYFAVKSINALQIESEFSPVLSKSIL